MIVYRPLTQVRAITFDLDDTLYDNMPFIHHAEHLLIEYISDRYPIAKSITKANWKDIRVNTLKNQPYLANDIGTMRTMALAEGFSSVGMDDHLIPIAVKDCFDYFYRQRSNFAVAEPVHEVLEMLAKRLPIAAITNGNVNLSAIGIEQYFSCIVHASPKYPMKPSKAMFDYVASTLEIPASNILHVGDDLDKDVKGAIEAGYQSAWLAVNRPMNIANERVSLLPHVQLDALNELVKLLYMP